MTTFPDPSVDFILYIKMLFIY